MAKPHSHTESQCAALVKRRKQMKEELTHMFTAIDRLYIDISKQGVAAHEAGDRLRKQRMETIAHHVYVARKEIILALSEALKPTEGASK